VAKKTLYQVLQVSATAEPEVIKAAADAKLAALKDSTAPEIAAERIIVREAFELLIDPVRRKLYDEKLREERFRALSSGGMEEARARPANARMDRTVESSSGFPAGLIGGIALLIGVAIVGGWVWLDHKRKVELQRLEEVRQVEDARIKEEAARLARDTVDWAKDRIDSDRRTSDERRQDAIRRSEQRYTSYENQRQEQMQMQETRRKEAEERRAQYENQRAEAEDRRRAQAQVERDRRALIEAERNHRMTIPR
jgi:curved DNA-binding protein CbpA